VASGCVCVAAGGRVEALLPSWPVAADCRAESGAGAAGVVVAGAGVPAGGLFAGGAVVVCVAAAGAVEVAVLGEGCAAGAWSGVVAGGAGVAAEVSAPFDGGGVAFVGAD
jgi:hypothetical protein